MFIRTKPDAGRGEIQASSVQIIVRPYMTVIAIAMSVAFGRSDLDAGASTQC